MGRSLASIWRDITAEYPAAERLLMCINKRCRKTAFDKLPNDNLSWLRHHSFGAVEMKHFKAALFIAEGARLGRRKIIVHSDATRSTMADHLQAAYCVEASEKLGCYIITKKDDALSMQIDGEYVVRLPRLEHPNIQEYGTSDRIKVRKAALWERLL